MNFEMTLLSWTTTRKGFELGFARKTELTPVTFPHDCMSGSSPSSPGLFPLWVKSRRVKGLVVSFLHVLFLFLISSCRCSFLSCTLWRLPTYSSSPLCIYQLWRLCVTVADVSFKWWNCRSQSNPIYMAVKKKCRNQLLPHSCSAEITIDRLQLYSLHKARMQDCSRVPAGQGLRLIDSVVHLSSATFDPLFSEWAKGKCGGRREVTVCLCTTATSGVQHKFSALWPGNSLYCTSWLSTPCIKSWAVLNSAS